MNKCCPDSKATRIIQKVSVNKVTISNGKHTFFRSRETMYVIFKFVKGEREKERGRERKSERKNRTRDQFDISHFNTRCDSLDASRSTYHTKCDSFIYEHTYPLGEQAHTQEHGDIFSLLPFVCELLHKNAIIKCNKIKFRTQFIFLFFALSHFCSAVSFIFFLLLYPFQQRSVCARVCVWRGISSTSPPIPIRLHVCYYT